MSEVLWHKNCRRQVSNLAHPPWGFNECDNYTNSSSSNNNDNSNNDNNNGNTDNKNKNVNNGSIDFYNS